MGWIDWLMLFWFVLVSLTIYILIKEQNKGDTTMTKICDWDDCNEEVADWQTHCPKHYAMMQQQKQQSGMAQPQQQAQVQQPQPQQPQQPVQQPAQAQPKQTVEQAMEEQEQVLDLPQLSDRERLIVKQTAFKGAIELMSKLNFEAKEYEDLINEVETLTVHFYRLIVMHNER